MTEHREIRRSKQGRLRLLPAGYVALVLLVVFSLWVPRFAAVGNLENIAKNASVLAIAACGQLLILVLGGLEFSIGASAALASVVIVLTVPELGVPAGFAVGALVVIGIAFINGVWVAYFNLTSLIATLGMMIFLTGLTSAIAGGLPMEAVPTKEFLWLARGEVLGLPAPVLLAILSLLLVHVLLKHSTFGRLMHLVGSNRTAAIAAGTPVRRVMLWGFTIAGGFTALAALILTSKVASGQPNLVPNLAYETIAACAIGGMQLNGGKGHACHVLFGVAIIAMINNAAVLLNLPSPVQQLMLGTIIIGSVLAQTKNSNLWGVGFFSTKKVSHAHQSSQ
ncbi:ABC transporter permease [Ruegeria atlantica]|uniref:ABC transporter permease n=1 Tax=Ruegeria atlantica TaxID=81569 RepID=UPI00147BCB1E|nr:ABC transporter permease [Ruegeria atlantica]